MFIVLEGADGVGKTTIARWLAEELRTVAGRETVFLSEPTNGPWGRRIREAARAGTRPPVAEEIEWFIEDRREDVAQNILPALVTGKAVVLDRYFYSNAVYQGIRVATEQGGNQHAHTQLILHRNRRFAPDPGLCVILTAPPEIALSRVRARSTGPDAFEEESYQRQVSQAFLALGGVLMSEQRPVALVSAAQSLPEVKAAVLQAVKTEFALYPPG